MVNSAGNQRRGQASPRPGDAIPVLHARGRGETGAGSLAIMADKITLADDGTLSVSDQPIIPFIEGDGTGVDIWPAAKLVLDAAAAQVRQVDRLEGGPGRREGVQGDRRLASRGDHRRLPGVPHRHQGPADDPGRRRLPVAQRRPSPDPRPVRVPAAHSLVRGRPLAGQAPRPGGHGHLPGEHRGHLRRTRGPGGHPRGQAHDRAAPRRVRLGHPPRQRGGDQAGVGHRVEAPGPGRAQLRRPARPQVGHPGAQGQHPEVHRGRPSATGATSWSRKSSPMWPSAGTTAAGSPATRSW